MAIESKNYNEKDGRLAYILMLDRSSSMQTALPLVKIDAKAFLRQSRMGDALGVNAFNDWAKWAYPKGDAPAIKVVGTDGNEIREAEAEVERLETSGCTNIGDAIRLANGMITTTDIQNKAFVLVSDGQHNTGSDPATVLGMEPPIYIAGIGIIEMGYFKRLLAKNSRSRFYNSPNAHEMADIFNQILSDMNGCPLVCNCYKAYSASAEKNESEFIIDEGIGRDATAVVALTWTDERFHAADAQGKTYGIRVSVISPDGANGKLLSSVNDAGFSIFRFAVPESGRWKVVTEHGALPDSVTQGETVGVFLESPVHHADLMLPSNSDIGRPIRFGFDMDDLGGSGAHGRAEVRFSVRRPDFDIDTVMGGLEKETGGDYKKLRNICEEILLEEGRDILPFVTENHAEEFALDGINAYCMGYDDAEYKGCYSFRIELTVAGDDETIFTRCWNRAVCVG